MVGELSVVASDRFAIRNIFGFKGFTVRGEDKLDLLLRRGRTLPQGLNAGGNFSLGTNFDVNVISLKNPTGQVRLVRGSALQPSNRRFLIPKNLKERERKAFRVESCSASMETASSISTAFIRSLS
ncbi:MAG: hypothetical protein IPG22_23275 [Acidobacteria bacterium]|nr:hypothetical protein [Acidobacteriota bacterium]